MKLISKHLKKIHLYLLIGIVLAGLVLRLSGIRTNHSFWADEAYMASFAVDILHNGGNLIKDLKVQDYQPFQLIVVTVGMMLFGPTEWGARILSVLMGTAGILFAYLVAKKFSNTEGGLLAAFLYAFSQLNIANATQAKQYAILETIILTIVYLLMKLQEMKKHHLQVHVAIIVLATISTLLHFIGILAWVPYVVFIGMEYRKELWKFVRRPRNVILILGVTIIFGYLIKLPLMIHIFTGTSFMKTFFPYMHATFFRELLWRNYGFIILPAIFGFFFPYKKYQTVSIGIALYVGVLSYLWIFKHYTHNIRYIVPLFGLLFVYFGVFWSSIGKNLFNGRAWITCVVVAVMLYMGGYKFVRKPSAYYSPNADSASDVQNADYKSAFAFIHKQFPDRDSYVIASDTVDAHLYYDHGRPPDAIFRKPETSGLFYGDTAVLPLTGTPIFTTLDQFITYTENHPRGIILVEDWESLLSDEVKKFAKIGLKLEYRVENMDVAPTDKWPLEVYSWGMERAYAQK